MQKWNLKIKFRFQNIDKSIQIPPSNEIQIFGLLLLEIYFSLQLSVKRNMLAKFQVPKNFQSNFPLFQLIEAS
jgi:hypothetical protein